MIGKLAGGAFVVAATSKIGFETASKYKKRVKDIQAFKSGMWLLKSEIDFSMTMLSFALKKCGTLLQDNVAKVFFLTANGIDNGNTAYDSWCNALLECKDILYLSDEDYSVLHDFAKKLGCGDIETEKDNIVKTMERLNLCEEAANDSCKRYCKMFNTIGITTGMLIVILLM